MVNGARGSYYKEPAFTSPLRLKLPKMTPLGVYWNDFSHEGIVGDIGLVMTTPVYRTRIVRTSRNFVLSGSRSSPTRLSLCMRNSQVPRGIAQVSGPFGDVK
jgi:hypothetical protein